MADIANVAKEPDEIEITPEMADAGALELARFDRESAFLEEGAAAIFRAMARAKILASVGQ
jgi:hypothetical protein